MKINIKTILFKIKKIKLSILWKINPYMIRNKLKLRKLKNIHKNSRCFILGNGPSLLKCDLKLLKDEITIVSNANYLIWESFGFTPNYITVEDHLVAEDRQAELNNLSKVTKIFPFDLSYCLLKKNNVLYINFLRDYKSFPKFTEEFDKCVYWGGTVSYLNLQLAYYLGFNEIYLIGFDHYYKVPKNIINNIIISEENDVNHIHPNYFGKGYRWHDPKIDRMEIAYEEAKKFFDDKNIIIKNATIGGNLETFERIDFLKLFK